ncbi:hypothetical protein AC249_AIPGENE25352 [Exaiptasia diaphana]|nr:hypothetical protein AC249_AIPGENE25352 [Exaiptasia diaphana]
MDKIYHSRPSPLNSNGSPDIWKMRVVSSLVTGRPGSTVVLLSRRCQEFFLKCQQLNPGVLIGQLDATQKVLEWLITTSRFKKPIRSKIYFCRGKFGM